MGFERPPDDRAVKWNKRPLVWVTGKETTADRVPPQDFVFAALKLAVDEHETWTGPVTALWPAENGALAVARISPTGKHAAYSLTLDCGR